MSTNKTVSLLISKLHEAKPEHCVAAPQLITKSLPNPVGGWLRYDVTMEDDTIVAIRQSGSSVDERTFTRPGEPVGVFRIDFTIGDDTHWKRIDATSRPPVHALVSAMLGNKEDESDGPFAMNTMTKPHLSLVGA